MSAVFLRKTLKHVDIHCQTGEIRNVKWFSELISFDKNILCSVNILFKIKVAYKNIKYQNVTINKHKQLSSEHSETNSDVS